MTRRSIPPWRSALVGAALFVVLVTALTMGPRLVAAPLDPDGTRHEVPPR